jgi:hypothetical protein
MADLETDSKPVPLREGYQHAKPPIPMKPVDEPFTGGYEHSLPPIPPPPTKQSGGSGVGGKK